MNETENLRLYASMVPKMDAGIWTVDIEQELSLKKDAQRKAVNEEKISVRRQIWVPSAVFSGWSRKGQWGVPSGLYRYTPRDG